MVTVSLMPFASAESRLQEEGTPRTFCVKQLPLYLSVHHSGLLTSEHFSFSFPAFIYCRQFIFLSVPFAATSFHCLLFSFVVFKSFVFIHGNQ